MTLPTGHDKIEFASHTDLVTADCQCPVCGNKYLFGVPYVNVPCKKCGITFRTTFDQDIYTKKARQIVSKIAFSNKLTISATDKYESSLIHIREHFNQMQCWDVSEITQTYEEYRRCEHCGICLDCFTCNKCHKQFEPDKNRRKQHCPYCKSTDFQKTYFKSIAMVDKNAKNKACPFCKSENVKMTRTHNKNKCHLCNSTTLSSPKTNTIFEFNIERKNAYRRP